MNHTMSSVVLALLIVAGPPAAAAGPDGAIAAESADKDKEKERAELAERLEFMKDSLKGYTMTSRPGGEPMQLQSEPLLRWNNPVSGVRDGSVFLWTLEGRPMAAVQVFQLKEGLWLHEFQSLSTESFQAIAGGRPKWSPARAGIEMKPVQGAPPPAKSERQRLTQMHEIVKEYQAIDDFENKQSRWELRLLAKPIYRYPPRDKGILDGALFAFAHGTDPEVFILLEAHDTAPGREWRIGLAPMTAYAVEVSRKETPVWSAPYRKPPFDVREPFFICEYHR